MNEIDLCADWKDKYQISLQNRARKYIYVEYLYDIILILDRCVSRFCVQDLCNRAHFPFRFDWMKTKSSAKKSSANAMVHITFFTEQCLLTWWALCLSISKVCYSKKIPIVSHYIEDCILAWKKTKIKVIRPLLHKHTMISSSIKE